VGWVVLTGYMGAGKTTVGRQVAARLGLQFVDSDAAIEERAGMTIAEIFSKKGEFWFRRTEETIIREIVSGEPHGVLAIGGGAVESARTRGLLARVAHVVWLRLDAEAAWPRVAGSGRPLAMDEARFARRYAGRVAAYDEVSHIALDASAPLEEVVTDVIDWASRVTNQGPTA
jgi:shikimate kinase